MMGDFLRIGKITIVCLILSCVLFISGLHAQNPYGTATSTSAYTNVYWLKADQGITTSSGNVTRWASAVGSMVFNDEAATGYKISYNNIGSGEGIMNYQPALVFPRLSTTSTRDRSLYASASHTTSGYSTYVFAVTYMYDDTPTTPNFLTFQPSGRDNFGWNKTSKYPFFVGYSSTISGSPGIGKAYGITSYVLGNGTTSSHPSEIYQNGEQVYRGTGQRLMNGSYRNLIGNTATGGTAYYFSGTIQEIIVLKQSGTGTLMNQIDREKVQSYLAIKYGLSLQGNQLHYYNSAQNPVKVWDDAVNAGYNNNVFGLARDDGFGLYQKQAFSYDNKTVSIFVGNTLATVNSANTGTLNDGTYLLLGSNGQSDYGEYAYEAGTPFYNMTLPVKINQKHNEVLKVQLTGVSSLTVKMQTHFKRGQYVMVCSDPNFPQATTNIYPITNNISSDIELRNGDYICFMFYEETVFGNFPYFQSFLSTTQPSEISIPTASSGANAVAFTEQGLRLTPAEDYQFGAVFINDRKFSSRNGIKIEFEYMVYGGTGADGFSVFFFDDNVANPQLGGNGAALGYSPFRTNTRNYPNGKIQGLTGAYLGIGFDTYGNFKKTQFWDWEIISGIGTTRDAGNHITLRGARGEPYPSTSSPLSGMGEGYTGYPVLVTQSTLSSTSTGYEYVYLDGSANYQIRATNPAYTGNFTVKGGAIFTDDNNSAYRKAIIELYPIENTDGMYVTVKVQHGKDTTIVINKYAYEEVTPYRETAIVSATAGDNTTGNVDNLTPILSSPINLDSRVRDFLRMGFAASIGAFNDVHLIRNLQITLPGSAEAYNDSDTTGIGVPVALNVLNNDLAYQGIINDNQIGSSNYINPASFQFHPTDGSLPDSDYQHQTDQGTWVFNPLNRAVTFTPNASFIGRATMQYSIKGGLAGHTVPYDEEPYRSLPATITVDVLPQIDAYPSTVICGTDGVVRLLLDAGSVALATEIFWYKDDVLLPYFSGKSELTVTQAGSYKAVITAAGNTFETNTLNITVNASAPPPDSFISAIGDVYIISENVPTITLTLESAYIEAGQSYLWYRDNVALTGETNYQITVSEKGIYKLLVSDSECAAFSNVRLITSTLGEYDLPLNVVPADMECIEDMPQNIPFGIREKFTTITTTGYCVDALSSSLVGDLNGDGKPEIVAMGVTQAYNATPARNTWRYINVFNGQDGSLMYRYDLGTNYTQGTGAGAAQGYHRPPVALALADLDNDGIGEIVLTTPYGDIKALKPVFNGTAITQVNTMWTANVNFKAPLTSNDVFNTPHPYIVDINGDGKPEVVVYNKIYNGQTGTLLMAWQGAASTPTLSNSTSTSGLQDVNANATSATTTSANATNIKNVAMTGRRPTLYGYTDRYTAVPAVWDIDGDGVQEIITGNRIYKFNIADNATSESGNTYTTIEGPISVELPEYITTTGTKTTHYLSDGFTRVADIDSDGNLDIIVVTLVQGALDVKILVYVWDPLNPSEVKAALTYYSDGIHGNFGIPFVGDINGKTDGWGGNSYSLKLPEICIIGGGIYINRSTANNGRTGIKFHPVSDESLRQGTASSSGNAAGWDNNQTTNSNRRFNRGAVDAVNSYSGHIIGLTYDAAATEVEERLKLSWGMEHNDRSDNTGITLFDFDNDGAKDLCYRDEITLRVISPARANSGQGSDYVPLSETASTPGASVMFTTNCTSGTGFEYPSIADVNLDGSADIVVVGGTTRDAGLGAGIIRVYEYQGEKWAPCPPVWNQSMYNPLHINEDLTVPSKPQPLLTPYLNQNNEIITPYNGSWIQQPIVKEGQKYTPVVRMPDAILSDMDVEVVMTGQTPTSATITLTIRNNGTASIGANDPIAFYYNDVDVDDFSTADFIITKPVGRDIFVGEIYEGSYTIEGDYNNKVIWARIMDDGTSFPGVGLLDCDTDNNLMSGIDCPYLEYTIVSEPVGKSVICGENGVVVLKAVPANTPLHTPEYKWYKDGLELSDGNSQYYYATEAGDYRCFVSENICRSFSLNTYTVTKIANVIEQPVLASISQTNPTICGEGGEVYLYLEDDDYENAMYYLHKSGDFYQGPSATPYWRVSDTGTYVALVIVGECTFMSNTLHVDIDENLSVIKPVIANVYSNTLCRTGGRTLLQVNTPVHNAGFQYQWYKDNVLIPGATKRWYIATAKGNYTLSLVDLNGCTSFSNTTILNDTEGEIAVPQIIKYPDINTICMDGALYMEVSNHSNYTSPTYIWYKNGQVVQSSANRYYRVTDEGDYFVVVQSSMCTSISAEETINISSATIVPVEIESSTDITVLCGTNSALILRVKLAQVNSSHTYQWFKDGQPLPGEKSHLTIARSAGTYTLFVTDAECSYFTNNIVISQGSTTIFPTPVILSDPSNGKLCGDGSHVFLYVNNAAQYLNPEYIWYRGTEPVQSGSLSSYIAEEAGSYFVQVLDHANNCVSVSVPFFVTTLSTGAIDEAVISPISGSTVVCGTSGVVVLKLTSGTYGSGVRYVWLKDGSPYNTHPSYSNPTIRINEAGIYALHVIEGECSILSNSIEVTSSSTGALPNPDFSRLPSTGDICAGSGSVYLYIYNSTAYSGATYTWLLNDAVLSISNNPYHEATAAGNYSVIITLGECSIETGVITLQSSTSSINQPMITSTTGNNIICNTPGVAVLILTNPSNFPGVTGYQWYKDGFPIAGATRRLYVATAPGLYRLQVMQGSCSSLSEGYQVNSGNGSVVVEEPKLALDPGLTICEGGIIRMWIENHDLFPGAIYLWYKNDEIVQNNTEYTYYTEEEGTYFVQVYYNDCSSVSAEEVINSVPNTIISPELKIEPESATICGPGGAVVIRLENYANFQPPATYQWYKNDVLLPGETKPIVIDASMGEGTYRLRVQNGYGCVRYSNPVMVSYNPSGTVVIPVLSLTPSSGTIYPGTSQDSVIIKVANLQPGVISYIWYNENELLRTDANPIYSNPSSTDSVCYIARSPGKYYVQAIYPGCGSISAEVEIIGSGTYAEQPQLNVLPSSYKICDDDGLATIEIINLFQYINPTFSWMLVGSPDTEVYTGQRFITDVPGTYYVIVTDHEDPLNPVPSIPSSPITLSTTTSSSITKPVIFSSGNKICGTDGKLILYVEDYDTYYSSMAEYRWLKDDVEVQRSTNPAYVASVAGTYVVQVLDGECFSESTPMTIDFEVGNYPVPIIAPLGGISLQVCGTNGTVILRVTNSASFTSATGFQWFRNEIPLIGETDSLLRVDLSNNAISTNDYYRIQANFGDCSTLSERRLVISNNGIAIKPVLERIPGDGTLCGMDGSVLLQITNSSSFTGANYYWFKNGTQIVQQGSKITYEVFEAGTYTAYVTETAGTCPAESDPEVIDSIQGARITRPQIASLSGNLCTGGSELMLMMTTAESEYSSPVYKWYYGSVLMDGAGMNKPRLTVSMAGEYRLQVVDGDCSAFSNTITVSPGTGTFTQKPIIAAVGNHSICETGGKTLLQVTNYFYFSGATFNWYHGNTLKQSGTSYYYYAEEAGNYFVHVVTTTNCSAVSSELELRSSTSEIAWPIMRTVPGDTICGSSGSVVIVLTNPEDFVGYQYQWYKDNVAMTRSDASGTLGVLPEFFFTVFETGEYRVSLTIGSCITFSDSVKISYRDGGTTAAPYIDASPSSATICGPDGSVRLSVRNYATLYPEETTYIWYQDDTKVKESIEPFYIATGSTGGGYYYLQVVLPDGCGSTSANPSVVVYSTLTPIKMAETGTIPSSNQICGDDGVVLLSVINPEDYNTPTYRWFKDNVAIPDATSENYKAREAGNYYVQIFDANGCSVISEDYDLEFIPSTMPAPVLSFDPDIYLCGPNTSVIITVTNASAFSSGSTYIWFNGSTIISQGIDMYSYEAKTTGFYSVQVVDGNCSTLSAEQQITSSPYVLDNIPNVTPFHPLAIICGQNGVVELTFTNYNLFEGYTIDWYKNNILIPSTTGQSILYVSEAGDYRVKAERMDCAVFSDPVTVTKDEGESIEPPYLAMYPSTGYLCPTGGSVIIYVANAYDYAAGSIFKWYKGSSLVTQGTNLHSYETSSTGNYYVVVLEEECVAVSGNASVTPGGGTITKPEIYSTSANNNICGQDGSIVLMLSNPTAYATTATFQWYDGNNKPIAGETDPLITVTEAGNYRLQVTEGNCSAFSQPFEVIKDGSGSATSPDIDKDPDLSVVCTPNGIIRLSVTNPVAGANYNWFRNNNEIVQQGTQTIYYAARGGSYFVQVVNGTCSAVSTPVVLTEKASNIESVSLNYIPENLEICTDGSVLIYVQNTNDYTGATYNWYKDGTLISGATKSWLIVRVTGDYTLSIIDASDCSVFSGIVTVKDGTGNIAIPQINKKPNVNYICTGGGMLMEISNYLSYTNPTYNWYKDGVLEQSDTSRYYIVRDEGYYFVGVTIGGCTSFSTEEHITTSMDPITAPSIVSSNNDYTICGDNGVKLQVVSPDLNANYQWYYNNAPINGATGTEYIALKEGDYMVQITVDNCSAFSAVRNCTFKDFPPVYISGPTGICVGTTTHLSPVTGGTWTSNNDNIATVSSNGVVTGVAAGTVTFTFTVANGCSKTTDEITVGSFPSTPVITGASQVCVNSEIQLSSATAGGSWKLSNGNAVIEGASTGNTVRIKGVAKGNVYVSYTIGTSDCQSTATFLLKVFQDAPSIIIGFDE